MFGNCDEEGLMTRPCHACGTFLVDSAKFCPRCGAAVTHTATTAPTAPPGPMVDRAIAPPATVQSPRPVAAPALSGHRKGPWLVGAGLVVVIVVIAVIATGSFTRSGDNPGDSRTAASTALNPASLSADNLLTAADVPGAVGDATRTYGDRNSIDCAIVGLAKAKGGGCVASREDGAVQPAWLLLGNPACMGSLPSPTYLGYAELSFAGGTYTSITETVLAFSTPAAAQRWMPKAGTPADAAVSPFWQVCPKSAADDEDNSDGGSSTARLHSCDLGDACVGVSNGEASEVEPTLVRRGSLIVMILTETGGAPIYQCVSADCVPPTTLPPPTPDMSLIFEHALSRLTGHGTLSPPLSARESLTDTWYGSQFAPVSPCIGQCSDAVALTWSGLKQITLRKDDSTTLTVWDPTGNQETLTCDGTWALRGRKLTVEGVTCASAAVYAPKGKLPDATVRVDSSTWMAETGDDQLPGSTFSRHPK